MEPVDGSFCLVTLVEVGMRVLRVCLLIYKGSLKSERESAIIKIDGDRILKKSRIRARYR